MPVDQDIQLTITCDNPDCPGHPELDPAERTGWLFISSEVYGEPTKQRVFGSQDCVNSFTASPVDDWAHAGQPDEVEGRMASPTPGGGQ